ncbi:MAG: hypothetical protein EOP83_14795 [Verrucomicrobiaceae bacterium]|nr:MAG: hypothetical protein EOP83_14795 [Verrucomicrobiaceae bacterium]
MSTPATAKVTRSVALDKDVAAAATKAAKAENRSFSNYVETLLARAKEAAEAKSKSTSEH